MRQIVIRQIKSAPTVKSLQMKNERAVRGNLFLNVVLLVLIASSVPSNRCSLKCRISYWMIWTQFSSQSKPKNQPPSEVLPSQTNVWIYSECVWSPGPLHLMYQSFRLNKLCCAEDSSHQSYSEKHISLPQYELFNEIFIILTGAARRGRVPSTAHPLPPPPPLCGAGKALRIIELWFPCRSIKHKDNWTWLLWLMDCLHLLPKSDQVHARQRKILDFIF